MKSKLCFYTQISYYDSHRSHFIMALMYMYLHQLHLTHYINFTHFLLIYCLITIVIFIIKWATSRY